MLALVISLVSLIAAYILFQMDPYVFLYSGDGSAHLFLSRYILDSRTPGLQSFGTAWLPFYHILLAIPSLLDPLFFTGIVGMTIGIPSLVGSAIFLFLLILRLTNSRPAAFLAALLYALNPNLVFLGLAPLTETLFLFLVAASAYCLLRWRETGQQRWLIRAVLAVVLATLTRYEAWILPPALVGAVVLRSRQGGLNSKQRVAQFATSALSASGILLWLAWNWIKYGNPLMFAVQIHGAGYPTVQTELAYHLWPVLDVYFSTVLHMFGPLLLAVGGVGLVAAVRGREMRAHRFVLFYTALPAFFALISLFLGFAQMDKYWWNSRYVVTLALPVWIGAAMVLLHIWKGRGGAKAGTAILLGLLLFHLFQLKDPEVDVVTYRDAVQNFFDRTTMATEVGERLRREYRGGTIALVTGSVQGQRVVLPAGIPLRQYYMPFGHPPDTLRTDLSEFRYIVMAKRPTADSGPNGSYWTERKSFLYGYYNILLENGDFLLLERHYEQQPESRQTGDHYNSP